MIDKDIRSHDEAVSDGGTGQAASMAPRKIWSKPHLQVIEADAAEAGPGVNDDGGFALS